MTDFLIWGRETPCRASSVFSAMHSYTDAESALEILHIASQGGIKSVRKLYAGLRCLEEAG